MAKQITLIKSIQAQKALINVIIFYTDIKNCGEKLSSRALSWDIESPGFKQGGVGGLGGGVWMHGVIQPHWSSSYFFFFNGKALFV